MVRKTVLEELLDEYPGFLDRRPSSNHYKDSMIDSEPLQALKFNMYKSKLARRIKRPLKIWREQTQPHIYDIKYEINLENIKRVKLYTQSNKTSPTELLQDSGELLEGLNEYNGIYTDETDLDPIPESFYFVEVEDYNGYIFQKGIPENNTVLGDIYDHDGALDVWGVKLQIPRRRYKTNIEPDDYPYTIPPYFIDETEADRDYEERMLEIMQDYQNYPLPSVETKRILGIMPTCQGRWRAVLAGEHIQDEEYNSSVFDFNMSLGDIPKNINYDDIGDVQGIIDRTMPLSKKGYFSVTIDETIEYAVLGLYDSYNLAVILQNDPSLLLDYFSFEADGQLENSALSINDYFKLTWVNRLESIGVLDYVEWTEIARIFYHDTNTDFTMDTLTNCSIVGTGAAAYVKLNPANTSQSDTPSGCSQTGDGWYWFDAPLGVDSNINTSAYSEIENLGVDRPLIKTPYNAVYEGEGIAWSGNINDVKSFDTNTYITKPIASGTSWSRYVRLDLSTYFNSIPSGAVIRGVKIELNIGSSSAFITQFYLQSSTETGDVQTVNFPANIPGDIQEVIGGSADLLGMPEERAEWNNLDLVVRARSNTTNAAIIFAGARVTVYWDPDPWKSKNYNVTGLSFNLPVESTVLGVKVSPKCWCETSDKPLYAVLTAGGVTKSKTAVLPTSAGSINFGSGSDLWGGLPSTPDSYNSISLYFYTTTSQRVRLYNIIVYVQYLLKDGTLQTATITAPADGYSWDKLEADQNVPSQCGANALLWDILKASDNSVLLSNQTPPIDLSGLNYQNLKVKAKLHTDNVAYYPQINWFKVSALKNRVY